VSIRIKAWLEEDGKYLYGEGRHQIIKAVMSTGSLAAAARELGMSYRAAWGRMKASEERLGFPLLEKGPGQRRAMHPTREAKKLMEIYEAMTAGFEELKKQYESRVGLELAKAAKRPSKE